MFLHKCLFTDVCLHGSWPVLPLLSLAPILSLACALYLSIFLSLSPHPLSLPAPPTHTNTIEEVELSRILENFEWLDLERVPECTLSGHFQCQDEGKGGALE